MANQYNCINNEMIEMTDAEQEVQDAIKAAYIKNDERNKTKMYNVRLDRDYLLSQTDWMAVSDYTMSDAWKTYRQALRDFPTQSNFPNIDFPAKPE